MWIRTALRTFQPHTPEYAVLQQELEVYATTQLMKLYLQILLNFTEYILIIKFN